MTLILAIVGLLALPFWFLMVMRWQRGFLGLLLYLPFAGAVSLLLQPSDVPKLFKDILFVIPAYAGFFMVARNWRRAPLPGGLVLSMAVFAAIVLAQAANPGVQNALVAAVGIKVWIMYLPLVLLAACYVETRRDLLGVFRVMVAIAFIPAGVGLLQFALANTIGYRQAIELFYGDAAFGATQGFVRFRYGGLLPRIPSTFTFVAQYFLYLSSMLVPAYVLFATDPSRRWRAIGLAGLVVFSIALFLSGARSAFIFAPLLLGVIMLLDRQFSRVLLGVLMLPALLLGALSLGGLQAGKVVGAVAELTGRYGSGLVVESILQALEQHPFGQGTGMNTGAARHVIASGQITAIESYYAKAIVELGVMGLAALLVMFGLLVFAGFRLRRRLHQPALRTTSAAIMGFVLVVMVMGVKGWPLDLDPLNVYFWVFVGFLFKLPYLAEAPAPAHRPAPAAARRETGPGPPGHPGPLPGFSPRRGPRPSRGGAEAPRRAWRAAPRGGRGGGP